MVEHSTINHIPEDHRFGKVWLVGFAVAGLAYYAASSTGSAAEGIVPPADTSTGHRVPAGAHHATDVAPG